MSATRTPLDELLALPAAELQAALDAMPTPALIALASPRSMTPVRSRRRAVAVILDEQLLAAAFAVAGTH